MSVKIRIRRSTTAEWAASSSILDQGELGLDITVNKLKAGNGINLWSALPFINILPSELSELAQDAVEAALTAGTGITKTYNDIAKTVTLAVDTTIANKTYVDTAVSGLGNTSATTYVPLSLIGNADGVASLDESGKIPDSEIPAGIARDSEIPSLTGYATETYVGTAISNLVNAAPTTLNTLNELSAALGNDASYASTITTALGLKAPLASPTFTGTVTGIDKTMVGLSNVDNTTDANKPVSTATQTALDLKLNLSDPSVDYYITNSGSGAYLVNGVSNGLITFEKGKKYRIHVNAAGHPFWIQTVSGAYSSGNVYSTGITNGGTQAGHILVELPQNAPDSLYYACEYHSSMAGSISVTDKDVSGPKTVSGASYTLQIIDSTKTIVTTATSGDVTITVPTNSSVNFPLGSTITLFQSAAGRIIVAPANGVTLKSLGDFAAFKNRFSFSFITLYQYAANSWVVVGDLTA